MKKKSKFLFFVAINYLLLIVTHAKTINYEESKTVLLEPASLAIGNTANGAGYSSDSQQVTSQQCYNAAVSFTSGQQANVKLSAALSFTELENQLGVSVSVSGKYEMFSADAKENYMRSLQNKVYTISLNYYQYTSNNVVLQIDGYGDNALNEFGKKAYKNGSNPYFGLQCGDNYVSSYHQGALLTMGLNIQLKSSFVKQQLETQAGVSFGDIANAATKISTFCAKNNIMGSVTIQAYQVGGNPNQLSEMLSSSSSGQFYSLSCSLLDMENCIEAANGLLKYAKDIFPKQFSFKNNKGLTPLGISFMEYKPINYVGLKTPVSLVTQEVKQWRQELSDKLKENQYYQQKIYSLLNGYTAKLGATSTVLQMANIISSKAENNIRILMQPHDGAADCFNFPQNCKKIRDAIVSQLQDITISDLKVLENMKYQIPVMNRCILYYTGEAPNLWFGLPTNILPYERVKMVNFCEEPPIIINEKCSYCVGFMFEDGSGPYKINFTSTSINSDMNYVGTMCSNKCTTDGKCCWEQTQTRQLSPFFFEKYKSQ